MTWKNSDGKENEINRIIKEKGKKPRVMEEERERRSTGVILRKI